MEDEIPDAERLSPVWAGAIKTAVIEAVTDAREHDEENAGKLAATAKKLKVVVAVLAVVVICLAVTMGIVVNRLVTHQTANAIQQNQINACEQANVRLKQDIGIWQAYIALGNKQNKDTAVQLEQLIIVLADNNPAKIAEIKAILTSSGKIDTTDQQAFLDKVADVDSARNCVATYNLNGANPASVQYVHSPSYTVAVPVARG